MIQVRQIRGEEPIIVLRIGLQNGEVVMAGESEAGAFLAEFEFFSDGAILSVKDGQPWLDGLPDALEGMHFWAEEVPDTPGSVDLAPGLHVLAAGYQAFDESKAVRNRGRFAKKSGKSLKEMIATGEVKNIVPLGQGGASGTRLGELEDGSKVVIKNRAPSPSAARRRDRPNLDVTRGPEHSAGAAVIADRMGLKTPSISVRSIDGEDVSVQQYLPGMKSMKKKDRGSEAKSAFDRPTAEKLAAFDYVVGNVDRHDGNWAVADGDIVLLDHDLTFPTGPANAYNVFGYTDENGNSLFGQTMSRETAKAVDDLSTDWDQLEEDLRASGLNNDEIRGVADRLTELWEQNKVLDPADTFANKDGNGNVKAPSRVDQTIGDPGGKPDPPAPAPPATPGRVDAARARAEKRARDRGLSAEEVKAEGDRRAARERRKIADEGRAPGQEPAPKPKPKKAKKPKKKYVPKGRTDEESYDYTDDPEQLAMMFRREQLEQALREDKGDSVMLKFDYEEFVPRQAVEEAVELMKQRNW